MAKYLADFSHIGEGTNRNKSPPRRFQCERGFPSKDDVGRNLTLQSQPVSDKNSTFTVQRVMLQPLQPCGPFSGPV